MMGNNNLGERVISPQDNMTAFLPDKYKTGPSKRFHNLGAGKTSR